MMLPSRIGRLFCLALVIQANCGSTPSPSPPSIAVGTRIEKRAGAWVDITLRGQLFTKKPTVSIGSVQASSVILTGQTGEVGLTSTARATFNDVSSLVPGLNELTVNVSPGVTPLKAAIRVFVRPLLSKRPIDGTLVNCPTPNTVREALVASIGGEDRLFLSEGRGVPQQRKLVQYAYDANAAKFLAQPSCFGGGVDAYFAIEDAHQLIEYQPAGPKLFRWDPSDPKQPWSELSSSGLLPNGDFLIPAAQPLTFFVGKKNPLTLTRCNQSASVACQPAQGPFGMMGDIVGICSTSTPPWSLLAGTHNLSLYHQQGSGAFSQFATLDTRNLKLGDLVPAMGAGTQSIGVAITDVDQDDLHDLVISHDNSLYWLAKIGSDDDATFDDHFEPIPFQDMSAPQMPITSLAILKLGIAKKDFAIAAVSVKQALAWQNISM